jgi:hypothetical protein
MTADERENMDDMGEVEAAAAALASQGFRDTTGFVMSSNVDAAPELPQGDSVKLFNPFTAEWLEAPDAVADGHLRSIGELK